MAGEGGRRRENRPRRTLVVPTYRESGGIAACVERLATSPLNDPHTEILFVDDGSDDGTAATTETAMAGCGLGGRVIRLPTNLGKGAAVRAGMAEARGRVTAFADADLSAGVDEIDRCFAIVESGDVDVAFSTRVHPDATITRLPPWRRRLAGKAFNLALRVLGVTGHSDTQCGLKVFTKAASDQLFPDLLIEGYAFDVEVLYRARLAGMRVAEVPIVWRHADSDRVRPLRDGLVMLRDVVSMRRRLRPGARQTLPEPAEMTREQFDTLARVEREHWWWQAKRSLVAQEVERHGAAPGAALDVGCGSGEMTGRLASLGFKPVLGTDLSEYALGLSDVRSDPAVGLAVGRADRLPARDDSVSCLTSLDVVEHLDDDRAALAEYARVLEPGGLLLVAVPAYQWAWSRHDVALGHRRRYTARRLAAVARDAGLEVVNVTHFHSWLVIPALLVRRTPLRRVVRGSAEDASYVGPRVNRALLEVGALERRLARRFRLPFGLSILLTARVPAEESGAGNGGAG